MVNARPDGPPRKLLPHEAATLPSGAVECEDGRIVLSLRRAVELSGGMRSELAMRRLTGADVNKIFASPRMGLAAQSRMFGLPLTEVRRLEEIADERDRMAIDTILDLLLPLDGAGLPQGDRQADGSLLLPLRYMTRDSDGKAYQALRLQALSLAQCHAIPNAPDRALAFILHYAARLPLPAMRALVDGLDATDFIALHRAVLSLTTAGREAAGRGRRLPRVMVIPSAVAR